MCAIFRTLSNISENFYSFQTFPLHPVRDYELFEQFRQQPGSFFHNLVDYEKLFNKLNINGKP